MAERSAGRIQWVEKLTTKRAWRVKFKDGEPAVEIAQRALDDAEIPESDLNAYRVPLSIQ